MLSGKYYDRGFPYVMHFSAIDFGGTANVTAVRAVPKKKSGVGTTGMGGRILGALVHTITENFAGSTTDGGVQVGDGSDADKYFDTGLVLDENVDAAESFWYEDDGAQVDIEQGRSTITVTFVATTGSPAGTASVDLFSEWFG